MIDADQLRQHVGRQVTGQGAGQRGLGRRGALARHDPGDQPGVAAGGGVHADHGRGDLRVAFQRRLDGPQFDAKAAQLDLAVDTAMKAEQPVPAPRHVVAAAIGAGGRAKDRVVHEHRRRQVGSVQIAQGDHGPADPQLSTHALRRKAAVGRHDIGQRAPGRAADGKIAAVQRGVGHIVQRGGDGGFGRTIAVQQPGLRIHLSPAPRDLGRGAFATHDQQPQQRQRRRVGAVLEMRADHMPKGGGQVRDGDPVGLHRGKEAGHRLRHLVAAQHQPRPRQQGGQDFLDRDVEVEAGELHHPVLGRQFEFLQDRLRVMGDGALRHLDPLGLAGGARGEDDIGGPPRVMVAARQRPGIAGIGRQAVQFQHRDRLLPQMVRAAAGGQQHDSLRAVDHVLQQAGRIGGVERQETALGLEHRQHGDDVIHPPRQREPDDIARTDPRRAQPMRQVVGAGIQPRIGGRAARADMLDRDAAGVGAGRGLEQVDHRRGVSDRMRGT